jgi:threonine/homoserine/homoserine lactone efflux protein
MNHANPIVPYGLLAFGAIYIAKPDIFYMWIARRADGQPKRVMPERSRQFMRALGLVFVIVGMALLFRTGS